MGRKGCSCTKKTGGGGKVWVVRGAAALRRLAVVARYEPLGVQLHRENTGVRASYGSSRSTAALGRQAAMASYRSIGVQPDGYVSLWTVSSTPARGRLAVKAS